MSSARPPLSRSGAAGSGADVAAELAAQRARTRPVDCAVDDDPVQPRAERPPAVEAVERAHGCEKRLLRDVLRGGGVVDDEQRGAVGARPVQPEELLERRTEPPWASRTSAASRRSTAGRRYAAVPTIAAAGS